MTSHDEHDPALDPDLIAYADGLLSPEDAAKVEARLAHDSQARDAVASWRHHDNLLHGFARAADDLPANLKIAQLERDLARKLQKRRLRVMFLGPGLQRFAAGLVLFVAGWWGHALYVGPLSNMATSYPEFVGPTLAAHYSYTLAAHDPVEFDGHDIEQALVWMSDKMQQKIDSPKLERLGYQIETARLITTGDQPVAVFYYRNQDDERVTVTMTPRGMTQPRFSLRLADTDAGAMAYWSRDGLYYSVVANGNKASLMTLAAAVEQ